MKKWFLSLMLLSSLPVLAGNGSTGGGMGVVCKNADGSIKSVELLDLWEARVIYNRPAIISSASVADQMEEQLQNFKNSVYAAEMCAGHGVCDMQGPEAFYLMLKSQTDDFLNLDLARIHRVRGATLKKTDDAYEVVTPSNCEIAQLIRFKDTPYGGDVLINQDLVDHMDNTNEAALYLHEALYVYLRGGDKSSLRVRRAIGLSFSGHEFKTLESFLPKEVYDCHDFSNSNRVFVYVPEKGFCANEGVVFQIVTLDRMWAMDFAEPRICRLGILDDVFNGPFPMENWGTLGSRVGSDFFVNTRIGGFSGAKQMSIQLYSAPDRPVPSRVDLACELKTLP